MSFQYSVTLTDATNALTAAEAAASLANLRAAMDIFARHITGLGSLEVNLVVDTSGGELGSGHSVVAADKETLADGRRVVWEGAVYELRTGTDPNGAGFDIEVTMPPGYLRNTLWLDPDPATRATPVAGGKFDAVSFFLHEVGHALGFNGRGEPSTGVVGGQFLSTYDMLVQTGPNGPVFVGPEAVAAYGAPIRLSHTLTNYHHYGATSADGLDLGLMEGSTYSPAGVRWYVDQIDLAILRDVGLNTVAQPIADTGGSRFNGFGGHDTLNGGIGTDTLIGGAGDDRLFGGAGNDSVTDSSGTNYLRGEDGDDRIQGGEGFDDAHGNAGDDTVSGGLGGDWVVGGKDNDLLSGDAGDDVVYGNLGNDTQSGGDGADWVRGGQGDDTLTGGAGDDWMAGDKGSDTLSGGAGADLFHTHGEAGLDRVLDFNRAEGDRVNLLPGTAYTVAQAGADVVISMAGGGQMVLAGVQLSSLTGEWIFGA